MLVHCSKCNKDIPLMEIDSNFHDKGLCILTSEDKFHDRIGMVGITFCILSIVIIVFVTQKLFYKYGEISFLYGILSGLPFLAFSTMLLMGIFDNFFKKILMYKDEK